MIRWEVIPGWWISQVVVGNVGPRMKELSGTGG